MIIFFTNLSVVLGLALALFKDYLNISKMWPRKQKTAVAESISITASIIGLVSTLPYLVLVMFVYHDWLVSVRTISTLSREFLTLLIGIGLWLPINQGRPLWQTFTKALKRGRETQHVEVVIVPQSETQIECVRETYPEFEFTTRQGGQIFVVSTCPSPEKAEEISEPIREQGFYVTHIPLTGGAV